MKNKNYNLYYFVVGEASGDLHASNIIQHIQTKNSSAVFRGLGGKQMIKSGFVSLVPIKKLSVMGFVEVLKSFCFFLNLQKKILTDIKIFRPHKVVLVDYPGFNLRLAKQIHRLFDIEVVYYISPQIWAWKENRLKYIKQYVNKMVVLFPFEVEWYKRRNVNVSFFGHPLVELYTNNKDKKIYNGYDKTRFTVALFPGSRQQEIKQHVPLFKKIIKELNIKHNNLQYIIKEAPEIKFDVLKDFGLKNNYFVDNTSSFRAFNAANFALVASGTASLECAITNTPMAVVYKTSFISWALASLFLKVKYVSIVNILNKSKLVEEFLQRDATPCKIAKYIDSFINNKNNRSFDYSSFIRPLNRLNTYKNTASYIIDSK